MNRIQHIAVQAGLIAKENNGFDRIAMTPAEQKFAELLILECVQVCKIRAGNSDYNTGRMHCASDIAEYFGMRTPGPNEPTMRENILF